MDNTSPAPNVEPTPEWTVDVWSISSAGKLAIQLTGQQANARVEVAGFVDPNRILVFCQGTTPEWQLFDIPTGKLAVKWADEPSAPGSRGSFSDGKISGPRA